MADLLAKLYGPRELVIPQGYVLRRPMASEGSRLKEWVERVFSPGWASEITPGVSRVPATIIVAVCSDPMAPAGFCAWDCTARGFLGPVGVTEEHRGKGIGRALVVSALNAMEASGYGYAVIGDAGPVEFFERACGAAVIPGSSPGIYRKGLSWK